MAKNRNFGSIWLHHHSAVTGMGTGEGQNGEEEEEKMHRKPKGQSIQNHCEGKNPLAPHPTKGGDDGVSF